MKRFLLVALAAAAAFALTYADCSLAQVGPNGKTLAQKQAISAQRQAAKIAADTPTQAALDQVRKYNGPKLDCSSYSAMDVAYIYFNVGPLSGDSVCDPMPSNAAINGVLAGDGPSYAVADAVANGTYVPRPEFAAVKHGYEAYTASKAAAKLDEKSAEAAARGIDCSDPAKSRGDHNFCKKAAKAAQ